MLSFLIIILCINIDAFSYGVAYGCKQVKFKQSYILLVTLLSTFLFAVPLYVSKFVFKYLNPTVCHIINGFVLIFLGFYYFLQKSPDYNEKQCKNTHFGLKNDKKYILEHEKITKNYQNNSEIFYKKFLFKEYFLESLAISVDAIFTALLSGFTSDLFIFYIFFYAFSNYFAIFLGNFIFYKTGKNLNFKLSFLSGTIFIVLGVLKFFGI